MKNFFRNMIRPIIWIGVAPLAGFIFLYLLEISLKIEFSKQTSAIVNLIIVGLIAFLGFPRKLGIPFGKIETGEFLKRTGFFIPEDYWKHVVLGIILAGCNLSGILIVSILTGKYILDFSKINVPHLLFCLNPALWEELFFRGVLMVWLLRNQVPLRRASLIQIGVFSLEHIKGTSLLALFDIFSVMVIAVGFTYVAYKTGSLLAGIIFHYLYDVFVIFVQIPGGFVNASLVENFMFYFCLWSTAIIGCLIIKYFTQKTNIAKKEKNLYTDIDN